MDPRTDLLRAAARLGSLAPSRVVVSTPARAPAPALRQRLDDVLADLEDIAQGIPTPLVRRRPLEIEIADVGGLRLPVPTLREALRIKAFLVLRRNATRDHLGLAALVDPIGLDPAAHALAHLDDYYTAGATDELIRQLGEPRPYDLSPAHPAWSGARDVLRELSWAVVVHPLRC